MIRAYTHHLRGTIQSRNLPLYGASIPLWMIPGTGVFAFVAVVLWAGASSPSAPTTAFVASQSSQQAVSTKGSNRFAGDSR